MRAYAEALRFFDTLFLGTDFRFVDGIKVDDIRVFMYAVARKLFMSSLSKTKSHAHIHVWDIDTYANQLKWGGGGARL